MAGPLAGKAALITGGGSGIGLASARHLLVDGCTVTLMGRTEARLAEGAAELEKVAPEGATVATVVGDVASEADVERATAAAVEAGGGSLHIAVAAAGTGTMGPILLTDEAQWRQVLDTNLTGAFFTVKHAGRAMSRSGGGSIVAISSIAGAVTHRFMSVYCVSKAGLDALVRNAADELGVAGIRVNTVRPGLVPTELSDALANDEQVVNDYLSQMPVRRLGTTDDIAAAVRYLAGPESGWVTGQHISVDGGHHLRRGPDLEPWARMIFGDEAAEGRV